MTKAIGGPAKPLVMIQAERLAEALPPLFDAVGEASDLMLDAIGPVPGGVRVVAVSHGMPLPPPEEVGAVVVTGAAAMVADPLPWIGETAAFLRGVVALDVPVLGICFGHQLLAAALGGRVAAMAGGPEYGTVAIETTPAAAEDPLFAPLAPGFIGQAAHYQAVVEPPPGAEILAVGASGIQGMRIGSAWGTQFHPEFPAVAVELIVRAIGRRLTAAGVDVDAALAGTVETPAARALLTRFGDLVRARQPAADTAAPAG